MALSERLDTTGGSPASEARPSRAGGKAAGVIDHAFWRTLQLLGALCALLLVYQVVVRFVLRGTNDGAFFGIPATKKAVVIAAHVILRVSDGKVKDLFGLFDEAGMLRQLGVLPSS